MIGRLKAAKRTTPRSSALGVVLCLEVGQAWLEPVPRGAGRWRRRLSAARPTPS